MQLESSSQDDIDAYLDSKFINNVSDPRRPRHALPTSVGDDARFEEGAAFLDRSPMRPPLAPEKPELPSRRAKKLARSPK